MATENFDIVVLGGGPGGYVAAIRAAQLGMRTALIEREHLGGICLNWGCIPTKALLHSAQLYDQMKEASKHGIAVEGLTVDIEKMVKRSRKVAQKLSRGVSHLIKKNKITLYEGHGELLGNGILQVDNNANKQKLQARNIILATGSQIRTLPSLEPDGELIWSYREALSTKHVPDSLLVVGAGAIGLEFASFFNSLGCDVTVVELADRILPSEDREISEALRKSLKRQGINIRLGTSINGLARHENELVATLDSEGEIETLTVDRMLMAIGVQGNTQNIGLKHTQVTVENGFIQTDQWGTTAETGIYAIGDVAGAPCLAHKASHQGISCVEHIAGLHPQPIHNNLIPTCTYTKPQIASIGLTEHQAQASGVPLKIGRFPFQANGKALVLSETEGMVKTIFNEQTGELLGAHMIGAEVTEMLQGYAIAMGLETTEEELTHTIFAHPTLSEAMHESVLDAWERAIHT